MSLFWHATSYDDVTGPFTTVISLHNGLHSQDQSNENGSLQQKSSVTNRLVE